MRSRRWRCAGALALACALTACRTAPPSFLVPPPWEVRKPQLQAREHFDLKGRVAVATGREGFNASLRWAQAGPRSQLTLEGPLGAGAVQVSAADHELEIVTSRGERLDNAAAHAELAARLGFDPPLQTLFQLIDLTDTLEISVRDDGRIERPEGPKDLAPEADLTVRAARALKDASGTRLGASLRVRKRIPLGSGLGGGSSDAATALLVLNELWDCRLALGELAALGATLGAGVPVFEIRRA